MWFFVATLGVVLYSCNQDPYKQGQVLYDNYCVQCHQANGEGYKELYPPLANADFLANNQDKIACIIYYGIEEDLVVNGVMYNQAMPSNKNFNDIDIANLINYINNNFGNNLGYTPLKNVQEALNGCEEK